MSVVYRVVMHWNSIIMLVSGDEELSHVIDSTCCRKIIYSLISLQWHNLTPIFLGLWMPQLLYHIGTCCTTNLGISSILQFDWKAVPCGCRVTGERDHWTWSSLEFSFRITKGSFSETLVPSSALVPAPCCPLSCLLAISHPILTTVRKTRESTQGIMAQL